MIDGIITPALRDIDYLAPSAPYPGVPVFPVGASHVPGHPPQQLRGSQKNGGIPGQDRRNGKGI